MEYVSLGRSGLMVSRICIGGNSWGAAGRRQWAAFGEAESRPFFKRALDCGINFFDTADTYNAGESERIVGKCLLEYAPRDEVVISTKVGIKMGDDPNNQGLGRKHLMKSVDAQLQRLGTDHIDLYQVHRLDAVTPMEEVMETLTDMVRAGKVRYVGGSTMPAYKFAQMVTLAEAKGYTRPIAMQNVYSLLQREEELEMNPLCAESGVGLIPYSPLARGVLAGNRDAKGEGGATDRAKKDALAHRADLFRPTDRRVVDQVVKIAARREIKPTQVALAWCLAKPAMAAPIIGTTKLDYIDDAAAAVGLKLSETEIARLEKPYRFRARVPD
jgi:aryl-alcohol dehydrogenase (NADP+)